MKDIAMCVMTYNHPEVVEEVLAACAQHYYDAQIDIYYYDSSDNAETESIVLEYQKKYDNIYYVKYGSDYKLIDKLHDVLKEIGLQEKYEYIWIMKDRSYCKPELLADVKETIKQHYDGILIGAFQAPLIGNQVYTDPVELYRDWGFMATSMDVFIYRVESFSDKLDVDALFAKEDKYYRMWTLWIVIFNWMAEMAKTSTLSIAFRQNPNYTFFCSASNGVSFFYKDVRQVKVWKEYWIEANHSLDEIYNPWKEKVIRCAGYYPIVFGSLDKFRLAHNEGLFTEDNADRVLNSWDEISYIPKSTVKKIALGQFEEGHEVGVAKWFHNNSIDVLVDLAEIVKNNEVQFELPIENLKQIVLGEYKKKSRNIQEVESLVVGSVIDILAMLEVYKDDKDMKEALLQILISMLILMN